MDYDVLVVGSGIGGMESALKLGDMGYRVLLVEKEPTVGGKMILLSKVFPTLDCASCISTPKMAAATHHPNVTVMVDCKVHQIERERDGAFRVLLERKPRFIDEAACTGCRLCEQACTVAVPDQYNGELIARRAAYIPFPQAVPQKALIERAGTSPCSFGCPAGIKAHGYVSLVRSGEYEKAFELVLEATPLAGTLGRACYAPCEEVCTRGELEGSLPIRRLKRFVADRHYAQPASGTPSAAAAGGPPPSVPPATGKRVAIVGSGPAGLTAAWQLARRGHGVRILEAAPEPGGALALAIPSYRLPAEVVERDIDNVRSLGVEIATNTRVDDLDGLLRGGFDAVLVATGTPVAMGLHVAGEQLDGVWSALAFLRDIKLGGAPELAGRTVVVIGGGNVAIDTARSARRLGAAAVHLVCLEARAEMPAHDWEVQDAINEGVEVHPGWGIASFAGGPAVQAVNLKRCTAVFDETGAFRPRYDDSVTDQIACESAFVAVGMTADTTAFPALVPDGARWLAADRETCATALPGVFAAGDAVNGPANITEAVGHGRRAAHMIDRYLHDLPLTGFEQPLPAVAHGDVLARQHSYTRGEPLAVAARMSRAPTDFSELEPALAEADARAAAGLCLDCGVCSECHECVAACPADAIDLASRAREEEYEVGAVIVSTGYTLFPADAKPEYGWGAYRNVITGTQMERLLAPTRPYNTILRPSDGKVPERIAYVMCTGSRDKTVGNPLCSKFCCMYSIKQNQLIMGALPLADVTVHYIDIRAVGKGYDEFFEQAKAMGANFVKGRVAAIAEHQDGNLVLRYEDMEHGGTVAEAEYDLVVLAVGVLPNREAGRLFGVEELALDSQQFVAESDEDIDPARTSIPGVFVAGAASGPKDIPESILHAGAAVVQAAAHVDRRKVHA